MDACVLPIFGNALFTSKKLRGDFCKNRRNTRVTAWRDNASVAF